MILSQRQKDKHGHTVFQGGNVFAEDESTVEVQGPFLVTFKSNISFLYLIGVVTSACYKTFADSGFCWHLWLIHFKCLIVFWFIQLLLCVWNESSALLILRAKWAQGAVLADRALWTPSLAASGLLSGSDKVEADFTCCRTNVLIPMSIGKTPPVWLLRRR